MQTLTCRRSGLRNVHVLGFPNCQIFPVEAHRGTGMFALPRLLRLKVVTVGWRRGAGGDRLRCRSWHPARHGSGASLSREKKTTRPPVQALNAGGGGGGGRGGKTAVGGGSAKLGGEGETTKERLEGCGRRRSEGRRAVCLCCMLYAVRVCCRLCSMPTTVYRLRTTGATVQLYYLLVGTCAVKVITCS